MSSLRKFRQLREQIGREEAMREAGETKRDDRQCDSFAFNSARRERSEGKRSGLFEKQVPSNEEETSPR